MPVFGPDQQYSRPTEVSTAFGEVARKVVSGAAYPANRDALVQNALDQDADDAIIAALRRLPDQQDDSPDAVVIQIIET